MSEERRLIDLTTPLLPPAAEVRDAARRDFLEARRHDWAYEEQRRLAGQGWPGRVIDVARPDVGVATRGQWNELGDTGHPELREFWVRAALAAAPVGHDTPGRGKDATWLAMEQAAGEARQRAISEAARTRASIAGLPPSSQVYFGQPSGDDVA